MPRCPIERQPATLPATAVQRVERLRVEPALASSYWCCQPSPMIVHISTSPRAGRSSGIERPARWRARSVGLAALGPQLASPSIRSAIEPAPGDGRPAGRRGCSSHPDGSDSGNAGAGREAILAISFEQPGALYLRAGWAETARSGYTGPVADLAGSRASVRFHPDGATVSESWAFGSESPHAARALAGRDPRDST